MKKNRWLAAGILVLLLVVSAALFSRARILDANPKPKKSIRLGVLLYRGDDTFIGTLRAALEEKAKAYEQETGIKVTMDVMDAKSSQSTQNSQVERLIFLGCHALCVNMVDRSAASVVIDKAMAADIPVVFFNREPVEEDMNRWEKLYYVGADAKESAVLQGQILVDAYRENPAFLDSNGDGRVSYVMLEGESSHQDSLIRTKWSIQTLKDGGIPLERLKGGIANWERSQASALMEEWLMEYPQEIELVVCNNDDMALGAIDAIERRGGMGNRIKLVGIDGNPSGLQAIRDGTLFGTVEPDRQAYAGAIFDIASSLALGTEPSVELSEGKYYWSSQRPVTAADVFEQAERTE